jgi:hypothetical protein
MSLSLSLIYHHQPVDPLTWIQKPSPNHVHQPVSTMHQPCRSTCTISCASTIYINLYHTMYINIFHTMCINLYQPCTSTCTIPCTSTMYHIMYINDVSNQPQHIPTSPRHGPHTCTKNILHTVHQICASKIYQCINKVPKA